MNEYTATTGKNCFKAVICIICSPNHPNIFIFFLPERSDDTLAPPSPKLDPNDLFLHGLYGINIAAPRRRVGLRGGEEREEDAALYGAK